MRRQPCRARCARPFVRPRFVSAIPLFRSASPRARCDKAVELPVGERAAGWSLPDFPRVRSVDSEKGVYGVESHGYRTNGVSRVTFINHRAKPVRVRLEKSGHDLLSGTDVPQIFDLPSGVPMFISYPSGHELNDSERKQWNR